MQLMMLQFGKQSKCNATDYFMHQQKSIYKLGAQSINNIL